MSQHIRIFRKFLRVYLRNPLGTGRFLSRSFLQEVKTIAEAPDERPLLTASEKATAYEKVALRMLSANLPLRQRHPGVSTRIVVSLTSYTPRFAILPLTLQCLLGQTIKPDRIMLWVAYGDKPHITPKIWELCRRGVEIHFCPDIGPFKKIIPTLQTHPDDCIVTADDDVYYWPTWLEELLAAWSGRSDDIVAHRVRRILLDERGRPLSYGRWSINDAEPEAPSPLNFATGVGGVLYPSKSLHEKVLDAEDFQRLSGKADDVWLYWMARLKGSMVRWTGSSRDPVTWPGSQLSALYKNNVRHGNDEFINAMINALGFPGKQGSSV